jgi:hypothetical protein
MLASSLVAVKTILAALAAGSEALPLERVTEAIERRTTERQFWR